MIESDAIKLTFNFTISEVVTETIFDVRINVKDFFDFPAYRSYVPESSAGILYTQAPPPFSDRNMQLVDYSLLIAENIIKAPITSSSSNITVQNSSFYLTDFYDKKTNQPILFADTFVIRDKIAKIEVLDKNFKPISTNLFHIVNWKLPLSKTQKINQVSVLSNLKAKRDLRGRVQNYYYLRVVKGNGEVITRLLDTSPVYKFGNRYKNYGKSYSFNAQTRGFGINVHNLQTSVESATVTQGDYQVVPTFSSAINIELPKGRSAEDPWYIKIKNGTFERIINGITYIYSVPEYSSQGFSSLGAPYRRINNVRAQLIESTVIEVPERPIVDPFSAIDPQNNVISSEQYLSIVFKNDFGEPIRALTTDPNATLYKDDDGVTYDVLYEKFAIHSVSPEEGLIKLKVVIPKNLRPYVSYLYEEKNYLFTSLSFNLCLNPNVIGKRYLFYVVPYKQNDIVPARTVHYLELSEKGKILDASESFDFVELNFEVIQSGTSGGSIWIHNPYFESKDYYTGYELEVLSGQNAGRKLPIESYDATYKRINLVSGVTFPTDLVSGDFVVINKRLASYQSVDPGTGNIYFYEGWQEKYTAYPYSYLLLGDVSSLQKIAADEMQKIDIRQRGGGVKASLIEEAKEIQAEVSNYWDIGYWDGKPFPGMASMLVELPLNLLHSETSSFSETAVRDIVEKHMPSGYYPVVRYYGLTPFFTKIEITNSNVEISWSDLKVSSYEVHKGESQLGMTRVASVPGQITSWIFTDLEPGRKYYIKVVALQKGVYVGETETVILVLPIVSKRVFGNYGEVLYGEILYS